MAVLTGLQPESVFKFFEEICGIPHGSGDTKKISDYLVEFAKERQLRYIQDELNNVIIFKEGTAGYEDSEPVIIQGHIDMVCEKEPDSTIDFATDGLELIVEGNTITANKTTLGGDDGIAVAFALAILDNTDGTISHPPIEAIFTVDEEIGMFGATDLDVSQLKGKTMLNIDSEDEGILLVSCAGGVTAACTIPYEMEADNGTTFALKVTGAVGGHSGIEIHKETANASKVLARALYNLGAICQYKLVSIYGGLKDNAITREATAVVNTAKEDVEELKAFVEEFSKTISSEYQSTDKDIVFICQDADKSDKAMTVATTKNVINAINNMPNGVQRMSKDIEGLVQTSLNLGIMKTTETGVVCSFSVRSSVASEKAELVSRLSSLMDLCGGSISYTGDYPGWEYKKDSRLRELMVDVFEKQYGKSPKIEAVHAGLECGIFAGKIPGLDCVSFGPQMDDIHTPSETMHIDSVERTWKFLLEILKNLK